MSKSVGMRISNRDLVHVWTMANNGLLSSGTRVDVAAERAAESVEHFKKWAADQPDFDGVADDVQRKMLRGKC